MVATHKNLAKAGISLAGSKLSLAEARQSVYLEKGGRSVSLVAVAGTHTPQSVAGPGDPDEKLRPRPGVNALRATPVTVLNKAQFNTIRDIATAQGQILTVEETEITLYTGQLPIAWSHWRLGTEAEPSIAWDAIPGDYAGIVQSITTAKDHSDIAIFYGLGPLTYSLGLNFRGYSLPVEWDDGIIAETKFEDNLPVEIILHPLIHDHLTNDTSLPDRAMPKIAPKTEARRILQDIHTLSMAFNTTVVIKENLGYITIR